MLKQSYNKTLGKIRQVKFTYKILCPADFGGVIYEK